MIERLPAPAMSLAALGGALLVTGCGSSPTVTSDGDSGTRKLLLERSEQGPVMAVVIGNPYAMDATRLDGIVTQAMGDGVAGVSADFTTNPSRAVAPEPRLVVLLNPAGDPTGSAACRSPSLVRTLPAGDDLQVFAAFCEGADPLGSASAQGTVSGPTDRRFQRLLWRTAAALFPDDYEDTYGFGLLPNSFDFGFGGSEPPPLGDDPLAPPEDFDPLAPQPPE
jgi:hypothetical protein